ncbi:hypothetical protein EMIHUDRAFT_448392, partial [Emiliania huxleyi CCMP1516]|uniref:G domain-containing protein n=2 Tax=Emiliania huxleyi TaxID=2903 RepID=A0A0D3IE34_EMIH1
MAKATRQVAERLAKVDFVIEVRDARVPLSSAAAHLEQLLRDTGRADRKLIAVNKADLVTPEHGKAIASRLGSRARLISTRSGVGVLDLLEDALRAITGRSPRLAPLPRAAASASDSGASSHGSGRAARLSGGSPPRFSGGGGALPLILMVVGAPNTGKSSLINALRRAHAEKGGARDRRRRSRRPARTGPTPGVTRSLSGFQVSWDPAVWLLDTPGVLQPRLEADGTEARRVGPARRSRGRRGAREFLALPARCLTIRLAAPVAEGRSTGRRRGAAAGDRPVAAVRRGEPSRLRGTRGRLARRCRRGFGQPAARRARHAHRLRASAPAPTGGGTRPPPARAAGWIIAAARPQTIATVSVASPSCTYFSLLGCAPLYS